MHELNVSHSNTLEFSCAEELLELIPLIMNFLREGMRGGRSTDLSVVQFRTLLYVRRHPGVGLNGVALFMGMSTPATSKLVEGLTQRDLLVREQSQEDRRKIALRVSPRGLTMLSCAQQATTNLFAERLITLNTQEVTQICDALQLLRRALDLVPKEASATSSFPGASTG